MRSLIVLPKTWMKLAICRRRFSSQPTVPYQTSKAHPSFIPGYTESPIMLVLTTQDDERIVQNICFRMSSRTIISHPRVTDDQVVSTTEASEIQDQIRQAIEKLPLRQRQVFVLRYYQDLPLREIGDILGLRIGTVKAQLFNSIRKLRQLLADYVQA